LHRLAGVFNSDLCEQHPGNVDGIGNFNLSINASDGFGSASQTDYFHADGPPALPWLSAANVLLPTDPVGAHIAVCGGHHWSLRAGQHGRCNWLLGGHVAPVPELATWAMMILGFAGVGLLLTVAKVRAILCVSSNLI